MGGAKSNVTNGVARGAGGLTKPVGGVVGRANSTAGAVGRGLGGVTGGVVGGAGKAYSSTTNTANAAAKRNGLPKPYPQSSMAQSKSADLPKPYGSSNSYPSTGKKTAVKPGQSKPFVPPKEKDDGKKPYPGTNTLPGQASRTPVKKYKPAQRYEPPAKAGEAKFF